MSIITIQCRLVANESTRRYLWQIMAEKNTPLVNELLKQVGKHPDFEKWLQAGKLPPGVVRPLCNSLVSQECFANQPKRFYKSAIELTEYIYKSWLALQQRRQKQVDGKTRWLSMLKSDAELVEISGCSLENIRAKALEILVRITTYSSNQQQQKKKSKKVSNSKASSKLSTTLFETYDQTEDKLERCAITYLLKNNCQVTEEEEDEKKFALRRRKKEKEIERLKEQLASRMPHGRDLTGEQWLQTLLIATTTVPESEEEARSWQSSLLKKPSSIPFPVEFTSKEDLVWSKNQNGRICVKFSGLGEHIFEVYCDRRQLHWFQRFLEDQQIKRSGKDHYSSGLFTLCSGCLAWQENEGRGVRGSAATAALWNVHRLTLYCSLDTRLWTIEGTETVSQDKAAEVAKELTKMQEKGDLNPNQQNYVKRLSSTLTKINNPYPRPSKPLYQGQTSILVGVSLGLEKPATAAVVDASTNTVLAYRSLKQLLSENYKLLNRQRQQQQRNAHERHKAQKRSTPNQLSESELGKHLDNLLAKSIITLAQTYQAGSIVVPNIKNVREVIHSEIEAKAENKCPNFKEGQQKYAKQYRQNIHRWSYSRLIDCIHTQAAKAKIPLEQGPQPIRGSPQEKARSLAIAAYHSRQNKS
ncbi:type V CRISPR-associated protein Cas12k [Scytonema sp. PCC 10023]|uniref:type V CRISPR-associated protein Cas12k n=1 Tax=Scytonema sp. PCC 10023 TaxID=1680591 RepID=UPI0039C5EFF2